MKNKPFIIPFTCIVISALLLFVVKGMSLDQAPPDYYVNTAGLCVIGPTTNCPPGKCTCVRMIPGQGWVQMYDDRISATQCITCLEEN